MIDTDLPELADTTNDDVAVAIQGAADPGMSVAEVVRFCGYLGDGPSLDSSRLYTHPWFHTWLTIRDSDVVAQVKTTTEDGKSYVWVRRDADIIRCQSARAIEVALRGDDDENPMGTDYPRH